MRVEPDTNFLLHVNQSLETTDANSFSHYPPIPLCQQASPFDKIPASQGYPRFCSRKDLITNVENLIVQTHIHNS